MEIKKLTKEEINKVREIEGFPIGIDEDIIALSDAPYYTVCPNPFIEDFIKEYGTPYNEETDDYHREPYATDVKEGRYDPIYRAHSYHTKVPYKAVMRYILHYTEPGNIVFDGFCGSGMTGVAANMCGNENPDEQYALQSEIDNMVWGRRKTILSDLSPIATFIARNLNEYADPEHYRKEFEEILSDCEKECGWMYETNHNDAQATSFFGQEKGRINYTVWSDVLICPHCGKEFSFWDASVVEDGKKLTVLSEFCCPGCSSKLKKSDCKRAFEATYDSCLGKLVEIAKQVPVLIEYSYNGKRYEKRPDKYDLDTIEKIWEMDIPYWYPTDELPDGFNTEQPRRSHGLTHVHLFYTKRNLYVLSCIYSKLKSDLQKFAFTGAVFNCAKTYRYGLKRNSNGPMTGTLYVPSIPTEMNVIQSVRGKMNDVVKSLLQKEDGWETMINTASTTDISNIPESTIDYIFTDPPFGSNINYSELSYIWESWLKVKTNNIPEAIMNDVQRKGLLDYQGLMESCFKEYYRVLKPNRWMTVEFHNSKNSVWNAIQESLQKSGFIIADVRTLDKKQGSFKQVTTTGAVKQDLVISAYKPKDSFCRDFFNNAGNEETAWAFIRQHLSQLPVVVDADKNGKIDILAERQAFLLFDRMVAYHIMRGIAVPIDAADFYKGLDEHFLRRDNMYFLPDQVNEYDLARATAEVEEVQLAYLVTDEKSAIQWLYNELREAQTYQIIMPKFMKAMQALDKHEKMPELAEILEENFLKDDEEKWYIPDLTKSGDIAKLREKNLLKEFQTYLESKGKLKVFRSEAVRAGFAKLWKDKDYKAIVAIAERLPEKIIQEDPNLLMYYDISLSRA